ncbi:gliding motility-associated ABC transporter ATP-binding subunit GldA [Hyphobacterium sp. CCMP332]|nr:gliding motility-associated ABC transporter ATP-binding subunit GldA [Hyphobacterium sp. CCMP332]
MSVIVSHLTKTYGEQKAVDDISFSIDSGEVVGFLGPNGAGKSTTMKIATGFIPPNNGSVNIEGLDIQENTIEVKKIVGYLPENNPLYLDMYVYEYLKFVAKLHGLKKSCQKTRIDQLIEMVGLGRERHKKIEELSKGYRQRIGLAQALIHDPKVLFLDEPTSGLDPNQIVDIRKLISDLGKEKTVVLSSHIMQEVEAVCNRAIIINRGRLVADDKVENLKKKIQGSITFHIEFAQAVDTDKIKEINTISSVKAVSQFVFEVTSKSNTDPRSDLFDLSKQNDWIILEIRTLESNLESIFHQLTQN